MMELPAEKQYVNTQLKLLKDELATHYSKSELDAFGLHLYGLNITTLLTMHHLLNRMDCMER